MRKLLATIKMLRIEGVLLFIPHAISSAIVCVSGVPDIIRLSLLSLALSSGLFMGNVVNSIADMDIDAVNPRTDKRPLVQGELSVSDAVIVFFFLLIMVLICTYLLNPLFVLLLPLPVGLGIAYCFSKRYTCMCHFAVGLVTAIAPVSAWLVFGSWADFRYVLYGAAVMFHCAGYDIIYSMQDIKYDIEKGMYSMPVKLGLGKSMYVVALCDIVTLFFLMLFGISTDRGQAYYIGLCISQAVVVGGYLLAKKKRYGAAFKINFYYGVLMLLFVCVDQYFLMNDVFRYV